MNWKNNKLRISIISHKMVMDDYDMEHDATFSNVINVYKNDNIDDIVEQHKSSIEDVGEFRRTVEMLRGTLNGLNYRYTTNIGARLYNGYDKQERPIWTLLQVWRGWR
jgi:hypothetical protein